MSDGVTPVTSSTQAGQVQTPPQSADQATDKTLQTLGGAAVGGGLTAGAIAYGFSAAALTTPLGLAVVATVAVIGAYVGHEAEIPQGYDPTQVGAKGAEVVEKMFEGVPKK